VHDRQASDGYSPSQFESGFHMRTIITVLAVLCSAAAFAQAEPPTVGGKPLVQVRSHNEAAKPQSIAGKLQLCLGIDDAPKAGWIATTR
jgi:hypothetical protein